MSSRLNGVAVYEEALEHRMVQASNLVLDKKLWLAVFGIDYVLEAKLMIAHLFRDQSALL